MWHCMSVWDIKHLFQFKGIGKVNFESEDIEANLKAILEELRVFGKTNNLKGNNGAMFGEYDRFLLTFR